MRYFLCHPILWMDAHSGALTVTAAFIQACVLGYLAVLERGTQDFEGKMVELQQAAQDLQAETVELQRMTLAMQQQTEADRKRVELFLEPFSGPRSRPELIESSALHVRIFNGSQAGVYIHALNFDVAPDAIFDREESFQVSVDRQLGVHEALPFDCHDQFFGAISAATRKPPPRRVEFRLGAFYHAHGRSAKWEGGDRYTIVLEAGNVKAIANSEYVRVVDE